MTGSMAADRAVIKGTKAHAAPGAGSGAQKEGIEECPTTLVREQDPAYCGQSESGAMKHSSIINAIPVPHGRQ